MSKYALVTVTIAVEYGKSGSLKDRERRQGVGLGTSKVARLTGISAAAYLVIKKIILFLGSGLL